jgi:hypothetical protein
MDSAWKQSSFKSGLPRVGLLDRLGPAVLEKSRLDQPQVTEKLIASSETIIDRTVGCADRRANGGDGCCAWTSGSDNRGCRLEEAGLGCISSVAA